MSAEVMVRAAVIAALKGDAALMGGFNGLFDGQPVRASVPYAVVGECIASDWGAKDVDGRELRLTIGLHDAGETPGRLAALLERINAVMQLLEFAEAWRIVGVRLIRSRVVKGRDKDTWQAVVDYRVRVVRQGG
ncbi:DUF3168 domain-containing protein [Sphingomonadales bacterium 56]|uniref:DUF3168 domain-containing protein n=1 Tax=unclassified Sphingobium TaxID=2611147 RepID=UPI001919387C|nr:MULTISPECIES: DUF3168 domain-containing protein [unclassified Sphingobium]MBY2927105.1 DUF3168 domain-containing protein [Sphingomonadales bacterium 56]MBY2957173.1 DUF3168 domain-containing protein [Sphingomonadales bacterium 58]CAD7334519.1 hypothetical protein SPHS8_00043 [Sphingobium sp. S8]CAD7334538.1 hypothetical protein SPHS6_00043 [Sphingobium sp. S6]